MQTHFGDILWYFIIGLGFLLATFGVSRLLRPSRPNVEKLATYESGEEPLGTANVNFNIRFYVIALIFILFEVELIFLFPWAIVYAREDLLVATKNLWGWVAGGEMLLFVGMLALGLAYAWRKGHLDWLRPEPEIPQHPSTIPEDAYQKINQKYQ